MAWATYLLNTEVIGRQGLDLKSDLWQSFGHERQIEINVHASRDVRRMLQSVELRHSG